MRILNVRLCNLNSLAGTWEIDFTASEFANSGIFAITGPTGSGKSTILDAICLALYGRTPRLRRITKSSNEIMSRRTGACFAEVAFETGKRRFRCHWSQHRSRKRPGGELQPPKHEIVDSVTDQVLESKLSEVRLLVEQFTGMDFERFTRSILLAQGGFAAFLQASGDQRAPILEQITGTEIYSRISVKVHERRNVEREQLELLREKIGAVRPMSKEEEQAVRQQLAGNNHKAAGVKQGLEQVRLAIGWLENIEHLQRDLTQLDRETVDLQARRVEIAPDLQKLELGVAAGALEGDYRQLQDRRTRYRHAVARNAELGKEAEQLTGQVMTERRALESAGRKAGNAKDQHTRELKIHKVVRDLDIRIAERLKDKEAFAAELAEASAAADHSRKQCDQLLGKLGALKQASEEGRSFLETHKSDAALVEQLEGIRQQLGVLVESHTEQESIGQQCENTRVTKQVLEDKVALDEKRHAVLAEEVNRLQARAERLAGELEVLLTGRQPVLLRQDLRKAEERLHSLEILVAQRDEEQRLEGLQREAVAGLEQLEQKKDTLQAEGERLAEQQVVQMKLVEQLEVNQRFSLQVRDYAEARRHLVSGEACPLCGGVDHPWALDLPLPEDVDTELSREKKSYEHLVAGRARNHEQLVGVAGEQERLSTERNRCAEQLAVGRQKHTDLLTGLQSGEKPLRLDELDREVRRAGRALQATQQRVSRLDSLEPLLDKAKEEVNLKLKVKNEVDRDVSEIRLKIETAGQELYRYNKTLGEKKSHYRQRRLELLKQFRPLGIEAFRVEESQEVLTALERRRKQWQEAVDNGRSLKEQQTEIQVRLAGETTHGERLRNECRAKEARLSESGQQLHHLQVKREQTYGEKDPDREERRLQSLVEAAEEHRQKLQTTLTELERRLHGVREKASELKTEIEQLENHLPSEESALLERANQAGFVDLDAFTGALLQEEQVFGLTELKEGLEKQEAVLASRKAEKKAALDREQKKQVTDKKAPSLLEEQAAGASQLEGLQQQIGADKEKIEHNEGLKQLELKQLAELDARQRELARWNTLHELIGSADGKKFRVFAQGLTFALMIDHANLQLRKMHDRYILVRDPHQPLELMVIDSYQAGETRSTRNLSGGESFIVSLALSLGLSAMASRRVRVDSLFLDEGFGTLDEDALDTALQTLSQLQQDGKLIGVISHVPLLKDRILTRIQVKPGVNGCSSLDGPGCKGR